MSARPWRLEFASRFSEDDHWATWSTYTARENAERGAERRRASGSTNRYRLVNRDTAEVIHV